MKYSIDSTTIRDEYGRECIFKGINFCIKNPDLKVKTISKWCDLFLKVMEKNGANIVRLGITWAGIEPSENEYDDEKIECLRQFVDSCAEKNIAVLLDMHQDLFTSQGKWGDGAPKWAIDKSIKEIKPMLIWAEGYFYMDSVQKEFNDFWTNKNGIQDKFVDAWVHFAQAFKDCDNVIGYDFLNEPYPHKNGRDIFMSVLTGVVEHTFGAKVDYKPYFDRYSNRKAFVRTIWDIFKVVKTPKRLKMMLKDFDSYDTFGAVQSKSVEYLDDFNSAYYQPFFDRMRQTLNDRLPFFEHNYFSNMGVPFEINGDGAIYSPHAYDVFIDTELYNRSSTDRIRYILDNIKQNQDKMATPVIFGEWGGGCKRGTGWIDHIDYVYNQMEAHKWSSIYWGYQFKNKKFTSVMNRPYPMAVCGDIIEYHSDSKTRQFTLKWVQNKEYSAPTMIYTPAGIKNIDGVIGENEITISY